MAHKGVLFLDELPEFDRTVLEVLRQPLESKNITISRVEYVRQNKANSELSPTELDNYVVLGSREQQLMQMAQQRLNLSARGYHRVLRVARTIADLAGSAQVQSAHLSEALSYRGA